MARNRNLIWLFCLLLILGFGSGVSGVSAGERTGEPDAKKLIAMVRGSFVDSSTFTEVPTLGAAVAFGLANDRLYLITADHVVRGRDGGLARELLVELRALPGESLPAEVLPHHDSDLDLAILMLRDVGRRGLHSEAFPFDRLGEPAMLQRGASVFSIGQARAKPWWSNADPDVLAASSGLYLDFESKLIDRGQSGGGLFDAEWRLVGVVLADRPPNARAIAINQALNFAQSSGYPVSLTVRKPSVDPDIRGNAVFEPIEVGDFRFDLQSCRRNGTTVRCFLAVTRIGYKRDKTSLCSAYFQDSGGRQPKTSVQFPDGRCQAFRLEIDLPRAFEMWAEVDASVDQVTIVLRDGSWSTFSGSAIFRSVPIQ